ncbi:hypothetical protein [Mesorhizobium sp. CN2-181]|uniref:hypothetical protein n=1 Tax=Mesorhizobium yinganensis TaxID=3157707 RepID=UPI0032B78BB9
MAKHPARYPKHDGDKGQIFGGECNTTACADLDAVWFNNQTYGFYCRMCAYGINRFSGPAPICDLVEGPLTIDQMNTRNIERSKLGF